MFRMFPWSNLHDLNLDWIVSKIKNIDVAEKNSAESASNAEASATSAEASATNASELVSESMEVLDDVRSRIDPLVADLADTNARLDNLIVSGQTTEGNTELIDIRTSYDGTNYSTAGTSVRNSDKSLNERIAMSQSRINPFIIDANITQDNTYKRLSTNGNMVNSASKVATSNLYGVNTGDTLRYKTSTSNGYYIMCTYDANMQFVNGIQGTGVTNYIEGTYTFSANEKYFRISGSMDNTIKAQYELVYNQTPTIIQELKNELEGYDLKHPYNNPFLHNPHYSHTLIDKISGVDVGIPSESIWNIQMDARLGFKIIEGNIHNTSDGNWIVMHGSSNKFGNQVEHVDGTTDIRDIRIDSVTLQWIRDNVRYKSIYPKYRVSPPTMEEWIRECKENGIMPLLTNSNRNRSAEINRIIGNYYNNFISYNASRELANGMIVAYQSLTTKQDILDYCDNVKPPFMYCMGNTQSFSDADLLDIVESLHARGYLIGMAGCYFGEAEWQRCYKLHFDFNASGWSVPDFTDGNLCNLNGDISFSDFTSNGAVVDNKLTLSNNQTVEPAIDLPVCDLSKSSMHITFNGTIRVEIGEYIHDNFTSDGSNSMWFSSMYINDAPTFRITSVGNSDIINISYKASKV